MNFRLITPPSCEPIHVEEAKSRLSVTGSYDDALIETLIASARSYVEQQSQRALVLQTFDLLLDNLPHCNDGLIEVRKCPLHSVVHLKYTDDSGVQQTLSSSNYQVDADSEPARIVPAYNTWWPNQRYILNGARVRCRIGYATPFTADLTGGLSILGREIENGEEVTLSNSGGTLPAPLQTHSTYYVVDSDGTNFGLSETEGGDAIELEDEGEGYHFVGVVPGHIIDLMHLLIGDAYVNREAQITGTIINTTPQYEALMMAAKWTL